jgi:hypothetical protein
MSKKILLDKISIPGIKPMKYTKTVVTLVEKAMKAMTPDEEVELKHLDFGRGGAGFPLIEMEFY